MMARNFVSVLLLGALQLSACEQDVLELGDIVGLSTPPEAGVTATGQRDGVDYENHDFTTSETCKLEADIVAHVDAFLKDQEKAREETKATVESKKEAYTLAAAEAAQAKESSEAADAEKTDKIEAYDHCEGRKSEDSSLWDTEKASIKKEIDIIGEIRSLVKEHFQNGESVDTSLLASVNMKSVPRLSTMKDVMSALEQGSDADAILLLLTGLEERLVKEIQAGDETVSNTHCEVEKAAKNSAMAAKDAADELFSQKMNSESAALDAYETAKAELASSEVVWQENEDKAESFKAHTQDLNTDGKCTAVSDISEYKKVEWCSLADMDHIIDEVSKDYENGRDEAESTEAVKNQLMAAEEQAKTIYDDIASQKEDAAQAVRECNGMRESMNAEREIEKAKHEKFVDIINKLKLKTKCLQEVGTDNQSEECAALEESMDDESMSFLQMTADASREHSEAAGILDLLNQMEKTEQDKMDKLSADIKTKEAECSDKEGVLSQATMTADEALNNYTNAKNAATEAANAATAAKQFFEDSQHSVTYKDNDIKALKEEAQSLAAHFGCSTA